MSGSEQSSQGQVVTQRATVSGQQSGDSPWPGAAARKQRRMSSSADRTALADPGGGGHRGHGLPKR